MKYSTTIFGIAAVSIMKSVIVRDNVDHYLSSLQDIDNIEKLKFALTKISSGKLMM